MVEVGATEEYSSHVILSTTNRFIISLYRLLQSNGVRDDALTVLRSHGSTTIKRDLYVQMSQSG